MTPKRMRARREKKRDSAANGAPAEPQTPPATPEPCDEPPTPPASPEPCDEPPPPPDSPEPRDESYDSTAYEAYASTYDAAEPPPSRAPPPAAAVAAGTVAARIAGSAVAVAAFVAFVAAGAVAAARGPCRVRRGPAGDGSSSARTPRSSRRSRRSPFACLAENTRSVDGTAQEPRATCFVVETADGRTLFGCSYMRSELAAAAARGAEQRAVAVVSVFPAYDASRSACSRSACSRRRGPRGEKGATAAARWTRRGRALEESYEGGRDARGRRDGYGTCASHRYNYVGDWRADAAHGRGSLATATFVYTGAFAEGVFHGSGEWARRRPRGGPTTATASGPRTRRRARARSSTSTGRRSAELPRGATRLATWRTREGDELDGFFVQGAPDWAARWTVRYADGRRYSGALRDGVPSGAAGMMRYADGAVYEGCFADGLRSGRGVLHGADGATVAGEWRCDLLVRDAERAARPEKPAGFAERRRRWLLLDERRRRERRAAVLAGPLRDRAAARRERESRRGAPATERAVHAPRRGKARVRYPNGDVFDGWFARGLRDGLGVFEEALTSALTGHTFDGDWKRGLRHGSGTFTSGDGAFSYCGQWRLGRRCGEGTATLRGKVSYAGRWRDDAFHGDGALVDHARNAYRGEFEDGLKHGVGEQTYADGAVYKGEWFRGERHGVGHLVKRDGETFAGSWVAGRPHGEGTLTRPDGTSHAGGFVRGAPHGWGVVTTASEERNDHPALVGGGTLKSASGATRVFER
ncbi:hypothetical protein JL720_2638 [Aureococcus anophagefferens]|nr:hypothetical protein JL720_2638 [Aureococcus anophagefferens]